MLSDNSSGAGRTKGEAMKKLQQATLEARKRRNDPAIGVQVHGGLYDVVRATPQAGGKYDVNILRAGLSLDSAIKFLGQM
jgi:hypothetical protein